VAIHPRKGSLKARALVWKKISVEVRNVSVAPPAETRQEPSMFFPPQGAPLCFAALPAQTLRRSVTTEEITGLTCSFLRTFRHSVLLQVAAHTPTCRLIISCSCRVYFASRALYIASALRTPIKSDEDPANRHTEVQLATPQAFFAFLIQLCE
jgi:hypothetical protein